MPLKIPATIPQHPHPGVTSYANCGKPPMEFVSMLEISPSRQIRKKYNENWNHRSCADRKKNAVPDIDGQ
ncbi:hypothetical protein JCM12294_08490 [Desulfocicer niacini]